MVVISHSAPAPSWTFDERALYQALMRRWRSALALGLVLATALAGAAWVFATRYTARALVQFAINPTQILNPSPDNKVDNRSYPKMQMALILSRPMLEAALKDPTLAELSLIRDQKDPVAWLETHLVVEPHKLGLIGSVPDVCAIKLSDRSPQEVAVLVNGFTDAYLREVIAMERKRGMDRLAKLHEICADYEANLRSKQDQLKGMGESANAVRAKPSTVVIGRDAAGLYAQPTSTGVPSLMMIDDPVAPYRKELRQVQSELVKAQINLSTLEERQKAIADSVVSENAIEEQLQKIEAITRLRTRHSQLEDELHRVLELAVRGEEEPAVIKYRKEIAASRATLDAAIRQQRGQIVERLRATGLEQLKTEIAQLQSRCAVLKGEEKQLQAEIDRLGKVTVSEKDGYASSNSLRDDIELLENMLKLVKAEREAVRMELSAPPRATLFESAITPIEPDQRRRWLAAGVAALVGFALALGMVAIVEFRSRSNLYSQAL
jgi:hypothetical protein